MAVAAASHGSSFSVLARVVAVTDRDPAIPLAVFVTASVHGSGRFSPLSARGMGKSGWRARREMRESVVTVAVAQPPVLSEVLLQ